MKKDITGALKKNVADKAKKAADTAAKAKKASRKEGLSKGLTALGDSLKGYDPHSNTDSQRGTAAKYENKDFTKKQF